MVDFATHKRKLRVVSGIQTKPASEYFTLPPPSVFKRKSWNFANRLLTWCASLYRHKGYACLPSLAKKNLHISVPRPDFKNSLGNFFGINMRCVHAKFQLSSFTTEGQVWSDKQMDRRHANTVRCSPLHACAWQKSSIINFSTHSFCLVVEDNFNLLILKNYHYSFLEILKCRIELWKDLFWIPNLRGFLNYFLLYTTQKTNFEIKFYILIVYIFLNHKEKDELYSKWAVNVKRAVNLSCHPTENKLTF